MTHKYKASNHQKFHPIAHFVHVPTPGMSASTPCQYADSWASGNALYFTSFCSCSSAPPIDGGQKVTDPCHKVSFCQNIPCFKSHHPTFIHFFTYLKSQMRLSINGGTPQMDGLQGKSHQNGWLRGTPILGNLQILHFFRCAKHPNLSCNFSLSCRARITDSAVGSTSCEPVPWDSSEKRWVQHQKRSKVRV